MFSSGSFSFRMNGSQFISECGRVSSKRLQESGLGTWCLFFFKLCAPIVLLPSGSYTLVNLCAPWFSKSDICCYQALNKADIVPASSAPALTGDKSCVYLLENEINKERCFEHSTRKIAEWEVCNVWTTNLQGNAVLRKAKLEVVIAFLLVFQKIFQWFGGVQNGELGPSDSVFNLRFVTNYVAKLSLAQRLTSRIYNEAEWNDTLPGTRAIGKTTLRWTSIKQANGSFKLRCRSRTRQPGVYRVRVPDAHGKVIPGRYARTERVTIRKNEENYPVLWSLLTRSNILRRPWLSRWFESPTAPSRRGVVPGVDIHCAYKRISWRRGWLDVDGVLMSHCLCDAANVTIKQRVLGRGQISSSCNFAVTRSTRKGGHHMIEKSQLSETVTSLPTPDYLRSRK